MDLKLFISRENDNTYNEKYEVVEEQRGTEVKLAPFVVLV